MQAWNTGDRVQAVRLFDQYLKQYPATPWAGEAALHVGYDAREGGRLLDAQQTFNTVLEKTSDKPNQQLRALKRELKKRGDKVLEGQREAKARKALEGADSLEEAVAKLDTEGDDDESFEIHQKAKVQLADLDLLMGHFADAAQKFNEIASEDTNWRRRTWAEHQLHNVVVAAAQANAGQLVACGPQALGAVLVALHKNARADKVRQAVAPRAQGFSLAELKSLAAKNGVEMRGFRGDIGGLAALPLPAILHYDFGADSHAKESGNRGASGHFVTLQRVDAKGKNVRVFDPLQKRAVRLSFAQLKREWSGQGLALEGGRTRLVAANLDAGAMKRAVGGIEAYGRENYLGASVNNALVGGGNDAYWPTIEVNRGSFNNFVRQTPLFYQPTHGPAVTIGLSHNSLISDARYQPFGNKWMFDYSSYMEKTDYQDGYGNLKVELKFYMPDGSVEFYHGDQNATYYAPLPGSGHFSQVEKGGGYGSYTMIFQDGSRWLYQGSGNTSFVTRMQNVRGFGLDISYTSSPGVSPRISKITDADYRDTIFTYGPNGVSTVTDPFGRKASFGYDTNGNLTSITDAGNRIFGYSYNWNATIKQVTTPQGAWQIVGNTVTSPLGYTEQYRQSSGSARTVHVAPKYYGTGTNNNLSEVTTYDYKSGFPEARLVRASLPDGTATIYEYNTDLDVVRTVTRTFVNRPSQITSYTYNAQGQVLTVTDPKSNVTKLDYATTGPGADLDVTSVTNANGVTVMRAIYNEYHQPTIVSEITSTYTTEDVTGFGANGPIYTTTTHERANTTRFSYTTWGALETTEDPEGNTTRNRYNNAYLLAVVEHRAAGSSVWSTLASYQYDAVYRVKSVTDAAKLTTGYEYDDLDRIKKVTYPDDTFEETTYAPDERSITVKDRSGRFSTANVDGNNRVWRTEDPQHNVQMMSYDANDNLWRLDDSKGNTTQWSYDALNRATGKQYQDGTTETYSYAGGLLRQTTGTRGQIIKYDYDDNDNPTLVDYPSTADVTLSYDKLDDVTQVTDGIGSQSFNYDAYGRLLSLDGPLANDTQTYTYDQLQRIKTQTLERGASGGVQSQTYGYDALGRLASLNSDGTQGAGLTSYAYEGSTDRLSLLTHPNGTKTTQQYDVLGRLAYVFNGAQSGGSYNGLYNRHAYQYNDRDVKTVMQTRTGTVDPTITAYYGYDEIDQLKQERVIGGATGVPYTHDFSYDAMGNRTQVNRANAAATSSTASTPNALNQLTSLTTSSSIAPTKTTNLGYDTAGNLTLATSPDGRTIYSYDDADRLVKIERRTATGAPQGFSDFVYDYASRKAISREWVYQNGAFVKTEEKRRVFDGMDVVQERNAGNEVTAQLVRDGNISGILSRTTAAGASFYGYDGNGNVTLLTDASGADVAHYRYDAWGQTLEAVGPRASENPYRFSTKEVHAASGLIDFGLRFYSPSMGRWINRDPLGEEGGVNLYAMVGNDPINGVDEYGLHRRFGGPVVMSDGSEAMGGAGGKISPGVAPIPWDNFYAGSGVTTHPAKPLPLSDFDKMMSERMKGVNPWMDGSAPIGSPMSGMGGVGSGAAAAPQRSLGKRSKNKFPRSGGKPNSVSKNLRPDGSRSEGFYNKDGNLEYRRDHGQVRSHGKIPAGASHEHRYRFNANGQKIGEEYRALYRGVKNSPRQHGPWIRK